ncbi:unnamed protein product [Oreochromis niloticus]|nr:unnamed protein product [Mustela putorius furo]
MERKFQLQHVELPDAISQLSSPADYRAAANNSELVERLEEVLTLWTNQIKQVLTESEQMRKEADDDQHLQELPAAGREACLGAQQVPQHT